jgi:hypothetical protein
MIVGSDDDDDDSEYPPQGPRGKQGDVTDFIVVVVPLVVNDDCGLAATTLAGM